MKPTPGKGKNDKKKSQNLKYVFYKNEKFVSWPFIELTCLIPCETWALASPRLDPLSGATSCVDPVADTVDCVEATGYKPALLRTRED